MSAQVSPPAAAPRLAVGATSRLKSAETQAAADGKAGLAAAGKTLAAESLGPAAPAVLAAAANDDGDPGSDPGGDATGASPGAAHDPPALDALQAEIGGAVGPAPTPAGSTSPAAISAQALPLSASAADLAAQMAAKVSVGTTQFKLQLNPLGLGQVDVTVSIGANRQLTAALAFADPQTASALSAHAGELRSVLEQAGFSVPANGVDFSAAGMALSPVQQGALSLQSGQGGGGGSGPGGSGHAPDTPVSAGDALLSAAQAGAAAWAGGADSRLDIRI